MKVSASKKSQVNLERVAERRGLKPLEELSNDISSSLVSDESNYTVLEMKSLSPEFMPYKALVIAFWLRCLRQGSEFFSMTDPEIYYKAYSRVITSLLARPETTVRVAVLSDDHDVAAGWSVFEGGVLHFVFVKKEARKSGVGRALLPKGIHTFTHMTKMGRTIWKKKFKTVKFNPF